MATITSATSGNWNVGSTWVGGVVPTAADDVLIDNGDTVEISGNVAANSLKPATTLTGLSGVIITADATIDITEISSQNTNSSNVDWLRISSNDLNVTFNSNLIQKDRAGSILYIDGARNDISINGYLEMQPITATNYVLEIVGSDNTISITGDVLHSSSNRGDVIYNTSTSSIVSIVGNCEFNSLASGTSNGLIRNNGTLIVSGSIKGVLDAQCVYGSGLTILQSCVVENGQKTMAVTTKYIQIEDGASVEWIFQNTSSGNYSLYSATTSQAGQAAEADVKLGVVYGPSNELTGTYDPDVVDVAQLAVDLLDEIQTSSHVVAQRLRASATDDSVGQIVTATLGG